MSSLPCICTVTLALLYCLTAHPLRHDAYLQLIDDFSKTTEKDKCFNEINPTFYTPVDVKENCLYSALNCCIIELDAFIRDCNLMEAADDLMGTLTNMKNYNASDASCSHFDCEVSPEKPFNEFLKDTKSLLQQIMSLKK